MFLMVFGMKCSDFRFIGEKGYEEQHDLVVAHRSGQTEERGHQQDNSTRQDTGHYRQRDNGSGSGIDSHGYQQRPDQLQRKEMFC